MASSKPGVTTIRQHNAGTYYAGILLALVLISIGPIPPDGFAQNAPETVSIPDLSLRAALEDSLGLSPGDPITGAALAKLTVLEVGDAGILDLTGLEHATGLARLDLGPGATRDPWANTNSVSDLSSLSGMTDLTWLSLAGNSVVDVTPLSGLGLTSLNLEVNGISDVTSLGGLTSLTRLYLAFNPIPPDHTLHFPGGWHPDLQIYSGVLSVPNLFPRLSSSLNRFVFSYKEALAKGRVSSRVVPSACDWEFVDRDFLLWDSSRPAPSIPVSLQTDTSEDVDTVASYLKDQGHAPERLRTWKGGSEDAIKGQLSACVPISLLVSLSERPGVLMVRLGYRAMELPSTGVGRKSWGNLKSRPQ